MTVFWLVQFWAKLISFISFHFLFSHLLFHSSRAKAFICSALFIVIAWSLIVGPIQLLTARVVVSYVGRGELNCDIWYSSRKRTTSTHDRTNRTQSPSLSRTAPTQWVSKSPESGQVHDRLLRRMVFVEGGQGHDNKDPAVEWSGSCRLHRFRDTHQFTFFSFLPSVRSSATSTPYTA